ncbi:hypothetical protein E3C22_18455 [Jiella endophytica]|uniref:DUF3426 domain-containing protein n=1 Tax=Jiella endophytica TaxID=2558362 RepID=A0A4Y8RC99_9HYPH|nr:hypothetical protein [Jiella endophytica]TFF19678.1 hypothetical protein E3C22_18455 [Jiella endophytica]
MPDGDGSNISQVSAIPRTGRPAVDGPCIEGVAEVTRRSPGRHALGRNGAASVEAAPSFGRRRSEAAPPTSPTFERGEAEIAETLAVPPDTQKVPLTRHAERIPKPRMTPGRIGLVACAFAFGALLLPVFLVSFPETPVAATAANAGGFPVHLSAVSASLADRGAGKILKVEGRIANPGGRAANVPPLRIDFTDQRTGLRSRTLQTSVTRLDAGRSIEFVSMVAVPADTRGEVKVGFFGASGESRQ